MTKILLLSFGGLILTVAAAALLAANMIENANRNYIRINTGSAGKRTGAGYGRGSVYGKPVIGRYLKWVRTQLSQGGVSGSENPDARTILIGFGCALVSVLMFTTFARLYRADIWMLLLFGTFCIHLNGALIRSFAGNTDVKLLTAMVDYIGDVKHFYHATAMVDEAIKQANLRTTGEMLNQGVGIYNILTGTSPEYRLREYYEICPSKFLKIFAGFTHLVREFGDKKINGVSLYIKNLNYITEEIQMEIIKKNQLAYWMRGLNIISLFPALLPPAIEAWVKSGFPVVSSFYDSSAGFYLKTAILAIIAACYALITQIQKTEIKTKAYCNKKTWDYYINKIGFVRSLTNIFTPAPNTAKYRKLKAFIENDAGSAMSVEGLYLRRLICGVCAFVIMLAVFSSGHRVDVEKIMTDTAYGIGNPNFFRMMGRLEDDDIVNERKINETDAAVIRKVASSGAEKTEDVMALAKKELAAMKYDLEDQELAAQRICMKIIDSRKEHVGPWEVLAAFAAAIAASWFPVALLSFRASLRKIDMEDEVFQFHTIIILLMNHDKADVRVILEWMREFAVIFRSPIELCLTNFQNQTLALERLREEVKFKPFGKIVDNLKMANGDIGLSAAFDALELEREFYRENRKESNKQQIGKKIEFGQMIGFIPVHAVLLLYMALPIIVTSFTAFAAIRRQLM